MHLMIIPIPKHKVPIIKKSEVSEEDDNDQELKIELLDYLYLMIPCDFDNGKDVTQKWFWKEHLLFVLG